VRRYGRAVALEIRPARAGEGRLLEELRLAGWRAAYGGLLDAGFLARRRVYDAAVAFREAAMADPATVTLVADEDGDVVGMAVLCAPRDTDLDPATATELAALYLAPGRWRRGLGGRLLEDGFRLRPAPLHVLWVLEDNLRARRFYEARGFTADGSRKELDLGGPVTEVRYRRSALASADG
jgi:GNAT superfamily N-acetyltransferase